MVSLIRLVLLVEDLLFERIRYPIRLILVGSLLLLIAGVKRYSNEEINMGNQDGVG